MVPTDSARTDRIRNALTACYCWHSLHANAWCFFCPSRKTTWHIRPSWEVVFLKRFTVDIYTLLQWSWRGVYWFHLVSPSVHLSICGLNRVHSVFTLILAGSISHLHILSTNYMYCVSCWIFAQYFYLRICTSCSGFLWTLYMTLTFDPTHDIGSVFEKCMGPNLFQTFSEMTKKINVKAVNGDLGKNLKVYIYVLSTKLGVSQTTVYSAWSS